MRFTDAGWPVSFEIDEEITTSDPSFYSCNYCRADASLHKDRVSLYVGIPESILSGLSTLPSYPHPYGISIRGISHNPALIAHELGHYYGLLHTMEDYGEDVDPLYSYIDSNIMSYAPVRDHFTKEQAAKMKEEAKGPTRSSAISFNSKELTK
jgi:hypothetical protein